jgi:hypothetical protein
MCGKAECRVLHRQKTQAQWRRRNRGYAIAYRIDQRAAQAEPPEVLRVPAPLDQLPWGFAKRRVRVSTSRFHGGSGRTPDAHRERRVPGVVTENSVRSETAQVTSIHEILVVSR